MKILVTGTAGFIGFHTALRLLERGDEVVGIDNINDYYDINLKYGRLKESGIDPSKVEWAKPVKSTQYENYTFIRPDMALFLFMKAILESKPIDVYNNGNMKRDFTYIDDIVEGIIRVLDKPAEPDLTWTGKNPKPNTSLAPYRIYNIGNSRPVDLMDFINAIEEALGKKAKKNYLPMQEGDVPATWADVVDLEACFNYKTQTTIREGIERFIRWYKRKKV